MAIQERNSEMVSLLSVDFIRKTDSGYLAGVVTGSILTLPGLVAFWPMTISLSDSNDIYPDYAYLPGRAGGQTLRGGTAAGEDLTLMSTANAAKGSIFFGTSAYDEANNRLGIATAAPNESLELVGNIRLSGTGDPSIVFSAATGAGYIGTTVNVPVVFLSNNTEFLRGTGTITEFAGRIGTAWTAFSYVSGWEDFGGGFQGGAYKKVGDFVFLRGMCKRTSGTSTYITTLPAGHRPATDMLFVAISNDALARIDIESDGDVQLEIGSPTTWVSLNGIVFSIL